MKGSRSSVSLAFALACAAITFSLTVSAQAQTVADLANFNGQTGDGPFGSVMQATDGRFYGTTVAGGIYRSGDVFEVTSGGDLRVLYSFCAKPVSGECTDGANSLSAPVLASDGNLYGVTSAGGSDAGDLKGGDTFGSGTVYKLTLGGKLTTLYTFCPSLPCIDGRGPNGLIQASDGNFYGTTSDGGRFKEGTIFLHGALQLLQLRERALPRRLGSDQHRAGCSWKFVWHNRIRRQQPDRRQRRIWGGIRDHTDKPIHRAAELRFQSSKSHCGIDIGQ
jgi:uncharacterized repeat protein (TIGR03803 family)